MQKVCLLQVLDNLTYYYQVYQLTTAWKQISSPSFTQKPTNDFLTAQVEKININKPRISRDWSRQRNDNSEFKCGSLLKVSH